MATKVVPIAPLGIPFHGIPAANDTKPAHHTITVHLPAWNLMLEFTKKDPAFFAKFVDFYPRFIPHKDIKQLIGAILGSIKAEGTMGLPYPSLKAARESVDYVSGSPRTDEKETVPKEQLTIRAFEANGLRVYMVLFPMPQMPNVVPWWQNTGTGISSRLAEYMLKDIASLKEVDIDSPRPQWDQGPTQALSKRIVDLLEREPVVGPARTTKVQPRDVYLYTSGMTAICAVHDYLLRWRTGPTVLFGLAFHQTIHIFEYWGPGIKHFPLATEYEQLEAYLKEQKQAGTPVQAVWTEFPSNPLIVSADLWKLRELCDKYNTVLVVDETVASFCNVDVLPVADIIVTSLTKSFNGYGDAIAGSAVLNPNSPLYSALKPHFDANYGNDFYSGDAQKLLENSEDYFARSATLNNNAAKVVEYLRQQAQDPSSPVAAVYYPTVNPSKANYDAFKRPATEDFTPGYGCLFSVELDSEQTTIAFYDNLKVNNGPHLGAHRTLALPYVKALYEDMEVVRPMGLNAEQVRISVGLEPEGELVQLFKDAVETAGLLKPKAEEAGDLRMAVPMN
jgi:cystathionine gamma-synthase